MQKQDYTNLISELCIYKEKNNLEPKQLIIPKQKDNIKKI